MPQRFLAPVLLVITALLWSLGGALIKSIDWPPMAISAGRSSAGWNRPLLSGSANDVRILGKHCRAWECSCLRVVGHLFTKRENRFADQQCHSGEHHRWDCRCAVSVARAVTSGTRFVACAGAG